MFGKIDRITVFELNDMKNIIHVFIIEFYLNLIIICCCYKSFIQLGISHYVLALVLCNLVTGFDILTILSLTYRVLKNMFTRNFF
jgi:hypothetical protein